MMEYRWGASVPALNMSPVIDLFSFTASMKYSAEYSAYTEWEEGMGGRCLEHVSV